MTKEPNDLNIEIIEVDPEPKEEAKVYDSEKPAAKSDDKDVETVKPVEVDRKTPHNEEDYDDFIFTRYHGKKRSLLTEVRNHNNTSYSSHNHFVKEAPVRRKKKRPLWKTLLIIAGWVLAALATLLIIAVVVFFIFKNIGMDELTNNEVNMTAPVIEDADVTVYSGNTISYNGTTYVYNDSMTSVLCMGVDKRDGFGLEDGVVGTGGQADALYLIAVDTESGETDVIAISRDIYSDIGVYSAEGNYTGTQNAQLCLAYAYGDGREKSCTNTVDAVSRLFYNLPINSYFAINMYAIGDLNDAVGGVKVELFDGYVGSLGEAGERIVLEGDEALNYLQSRDVYELESSVDRMSRQIHYLERFARTTIKMTKKDLTTPVRLFNIVQENSVTNLNASKISALAYSVATSGKEVEFKKVPGEVVHNGEYAEYVVDEKAMLELILDIYYEPKASE